MKAPLGQLRFREAQPPRNWTDTFDATEEGPSYCMTDFVTNLQDGQENAGTINVYSKNLTPEKLYPVMIWVREKCCRSSSQFSSIEASFRFMAEDFVADQVEQISTDLTTCFRKMLSWYLSTIDSVQSDFSV